MRIASDHVNLPLVWIPTVGRPGQVFRDVTFLYIVFNRSECARQLILPLSIGAATGYCCGSL